MTQRIRGLICATAIALPLSPATAQKLSTQIHAITSAGIGQKIGTIALSDSERGLVLSVSVAGLPTGTHGFHVHENGRCEPGEKNGKPEAGAAAGDHYDPAATKSHQGPEGQGHKGDLPALRVVQDGTQIDVIAPRLTLQEVRGRALIIHEGGDTYSDSPELGGGKSRIACAVIP